MKSSLTSIIQEAVLEGGKPAKSVAEDIGKPYPTLLREINPYDSGAKVGVDSLVPLMQSTQNVKPLEYLARHMGYGLVPTSAGGHTSWEALGRAMEVMDELGALTKSLRRATVQGRIDSGEFEAVERAGREAASAILTLVESLRPLVVEDGAGALAVERLVERTSRTLERAVA